MMYCQHELVLGQRKIKPLQMLTQTPSTSAAKLLSCEPPTPPPMRTNNKSTCNILLFYNIL